MRIRYKPVVCVQLVAECDYGLGSLNLRVGGVIATVAMVYRNLHESRRRAYVIVDDCGYCNGTMINRVHQVENKRALVSNLGCWNQGSECSSTDIGCGPKFCKDALLE